jgi:hypothetical protein
MDLSEKTIEICRELSKEGNILEPMEFDSGGIFSKKNTIYAGFYSKKRFSLFHQKPIFQLIMQYEKPFLTSFSREYDEEIENIAKKENFAYSFAEHPKNTLYF